MGLKKELTVQSCTATRLTYFKIRQRVGSCYHRSLWQTAPCVFVRQHRSGPFHLTATLHPAPLLYRRGKWTPFYPLWSKVTTQFDIPQKYFKDQRRKCGDLLEKTCSAPPPPPKPPPLHHHPAENHIYGLRWWWVVPWILSQMAPYNENVCEIFVPTAELFLVTKHKFKLQQFEYMRLVISKKSLQSSRSTLFASQMFPYDRLFDLLTTSWEDSTRSTRL